MATEKRATTNRPDRKDSRFKTLRHIEAVRNYINRCVVELMHRGEQHDRTKLESPELEGFDAIIYCCH